MDPRAQLDGFIDRYTPDVAADARKALAFVTARLPTASRLVYDNYNALAGLMSAMGGGLRRWTQHFTGDR